jgi:hypothetical protein
LATLASILAVGGLAVLIWMFSRRSLWIDEAMGMLNYPLSNPLDAFGPLPLYTQASPPGFSLLISMLAFLPPERARSALAVAIICITLLALRGYSDNRWFLPVAALAICAPIKFLFYATELKYYGLEAAGAVIAFGWIAARSLSSPFTIRDVAVLLASAFCGIITLVIAACAAAVFLVMRIINGHRPRAVEYVYAFALACALGLYYLLIKHATSLQMQTYSNVYDLNGWAAIRAVLSYAGNYLGYPGLIACLVAVAACLAGMRAERSRKLAGLTFVVMGAVMTIAFLGKFPVSAARHVAFLGGIAIVLSVNAVFIQRSFYGTRSLVRGGTCLVLVVLFAWNLTRGFPYVSKGVVDNDLIIAWIDEQAPTSIGLWNGAQPVIDYYKPWDAALYRHHYFGKVNATTAAPDPRFFDHALPAKDYQAVALWIEGARSEPGAWARMSLYRRVSNMIAPARSLVAAAPRGSDFLVVATHMEMPGESPDYRTNSLMDALSEANCTSSKVLSVRSAFVLRARCPIGGADG